MLYSDVTCLCVIKLVLSRVYIFVKKMYHKMHIFKRIDFLTCNGFFRLSTAFSIGLLNKVDILPTSPLIEYGAKSELVPLHITHVGGISFYGGILFFLTSSSTWFPTLTPCVCRSAYHMNYVYEKIDLRISVLLIV